MTDTTHKGAVGAETMTAGQSLDLRDLHAANIARQAEWCPDQVPDLSFRGNELGGECGEAQNVIKKLERERQGWRGSRATKDDLADELADVVICADLCAVTADIDLGAAVRRKFNATSEKQGLSVFLPAPAPRTDGGMTAGEVDLDGEPGSNLAPWLLSGTDEEVIEALMHRSAGDVACLFFPTPVKIVDPIRRTYHTGRPPRQQRLLCELLHRMILRATPAQPAGAVPDGLRDALTLLVYKFACPHGHAALSRERNDAGWLEAQDEADAFIAKHLSTHSAGQSAGSGAEIEAPLKPCPWEEPHLCCYPKCTCASDREAAAVPESVRRLKDAMRPFLQERERWSDPRFKHGDERHAYLTLGSIRRLCAAYEAITDVPPSVWANEGKTSEAQS